MSVNVGSILLDMNKFFWVIVFCAFNALSWGQHCSHQQGMLKSSHASRLDTMDILHHEISLDFTAFSAATFRGVSTMQVRVVQPTSQLHFDLEALTVDSVKVDGMTMPFDWVAQGFVIQNAGAWVNPDTLEVQVWYGGHPMTDGTWGGFYYNSQYAYNMGVGFDSDPHCLGRAWHPCIDDFSDRATYDLSVETLIAHRAICGGVMQSEEILPNTHRLSHWHLEEPIPSYLASVSVGSYVHTEEDWVSQDGDVIPIWLASKATDTTNFKNSLVHLPDVLTAYEGHFGPYPFQRVGYVAVPFSGGAMEHATNIAYPLFAINGNLTYETLYAHELSHMWWGDAVTCVSQEEMWLNEGWASYCESLALEALYGANAYRSEQDDLHREVLTSAHVTDGGYYAVSGVPHSLTYGTTVYRKGAWVVHSLRGIMGDQAFFNACRDYQAQRAFQSHNSIQLRDFFQSYTMQDLTAFFDTYVFQPGFPEFRIVGYSVESMDAPNSFAVHIQTEHHLHRQNDFCAAIPIELGLRKSNGEWFVTTIQQQQAFQEFDAIVDFIPTDVVINPNEKIHQAVLSQEKWISTLGTHDLTYAELTLIANSLGNQDSVWCRVENHFAEANYGHCISGTDWILSGDRMLEVHLSDTVGISISAKMKFQANNAARYDTLLWADLQSMGLGEDSLHLLYRPLAGGEWQLYPDATVNSMGSTTNGNGRFDISNLRSGQYTFGFHSGTVNVVSDWENDSQDLFAVKGQILTAKMKIDQLNIYDMTGRCIESKKKVNLGDNIYVANHQQFLIQGQVAGKQQIQKIIIP